MERTVDFQNMDGWMDGKTKTYYRYTYKHIQCVHYV